MAARVQGRDLHFAIALGRERQTILRAEVELVSAEAQLAETPDCPAAQQAVREARKALRDLIEPFKPGGDDHPYSYIIDEINLVHLEQELLLWDMPEGEIRTALARSLARRESAAYDALADAATEPPLLRPCVSL